MSAIFEIAAKIWISATCDVTCAGITGEVWRQRTRPRKKEKFYLMKIFENRFWFHLL